MHIELADAQSFLENTKCNLVSLEAVLENEQSTLVLGMLADTYMYLKIPAIKVMAGCFDLRRCS
jgi:hypothetical protein